jgi:hypothetical protein
MTHRSTEGKTDTSVIDANDVFDASTFEGYQIRKVWPAGSPHSLQMVSIPFGRMPEEVKARLLAEPGLAERLDDDTTIDLGPTECWSLFGSGGGSFGPRRKLPAAELIETIRRLEPVAVRRERDRADAEAMEKDEAARAERQAQERAEAERRTQEVAAKEEAEFQALRMKNPAYVLDRCLDVLRQVQETAARMEALAARVERSTPR